MRFKIIAAVVTAMALTVTAVGVASATSGPVRTTSGVEHYWVGDFSLTTGHPTAFVGTGLFTDAGSISSNGSILRLSKGTFAVNTRKVTTKPAINETTCFGTLGFGGTIGLSGGTGAYKGISGTLPIGGTLVLVFPRLKNGKCNTSNSFEPLAVVGTPSGSGDVTLGG
jgi:hypothetical protein